MMFPLIIAEGDKVWHHFKTTGTHRGEFRGLAPTGKKLTYTAVAIWRIVEGKVVEGWGIMTKWISSNN